MILDEPVLMVLPIKWIPFCFDSGYGAPSYSAPSYGGGGKDFDDFLNALAAFLPIALFLAAIPPNLVVVNDRKKRSLTDSSETSGNIRERLLKFARVSNPRNEQQITTYDYFRQ